MMKRIEVWRAPFFYALLPTVMFLVIVFGQRWIPIHDTYYSATTAWYIFNEYVTNNELPLWYPFIKYGIDTNWYLQLSITPSLALLLPIAKLLGDVNFLNLFYTALIMDELVLLMGTYLLCNLIYTDRLTSIFVSIAMTGSVIWLSESYFNFHLYYLMPLSMYFVIRGCRENEIWKILSGGIILLMASFGNAPYFLFLLGFIYVIFTILCVIAFKLDISHALNRVGRKEAFIVVASAILLALFVGLMTYGVDRVNYSPGRNVNNTTGYDPFLTYGGSIGLSKFSEIFTGTSWTPEVNVYAGVLVFAMALFGLLWSPSRKQIPFLLVGIIMALFSLGKESFIAPLSYYFPGLNYYRHIGLVSPIIKVMIIFLAGFGFDALVTSLKGVQDKENTNHVKKVVIVNITILLAMLLISAIIGIVSVLTIKMSGGAIAVFNDFVGTRFSQPTQYASRAAFVVVLYVVAIYLFWMLKESRNKNIVRIVLISLVVLQTVDVYSYRSSMYHEYMRQIPDNYWELFRFRKVPMAEKRVTNYFENENFANVASNYPSWITKEWFGACGAEYCDIPHTVTNHGSYYHTEDAFLGLDPCRSLFRGDYWLSGVDRFYRAAMKMPLHDLTILPQGMDIGRIYIPKDKQQFNQMIGCNYPKVQVYTSLNIAEDDNELANIIGDDRLNADILLSNKELYSQYLADKSIAQISNTLPKESIRAQFTDDRISAKVNVIDFSANRVRIKVDTPAHHDRYWLYYADAWHPFWHSYVNGVKLPVLNVNFGFKAVPIPSGSSEIEFVYESVTLKMIIIAFWLVIAGFMLFMLYKFGRLVRDELTGLP